MMFVTDPVSSVSLGVGVVLLFKSFVGGVPPHFPLTVVGVLVPFADIDDVPLVVSDLPVSVLITIVVLALINIAGFRLHFFLLK